MEKNNSTLTIGNEKMVQFASNHNTGGGDAELVRT